jgi:hypothetical protein
MNSQDPSHLPFFTRYTTLVTETDLVGAMRAQITDLRRLLDTVDEANADRVHPPFAWTIKQVLQHMIDTERVFGYRAMRFSRGDNLPLPGFDQDAYANAIDVAPWRLADLVYEFEFLRNSHYLMFTHLPADAWTRKGTASNLEWSVTDLAKAIIGHARHHLQIIEKRLQT